MTGRINNKPEEKSEGKQKRGDKITKGLREVRKCRETNIVRRRNVEKEGRRRVMLDGRLQLKCDGTR